VPRQPRLLDRLDIARAGSRHGIREGAIIAADRAGTAWRDRLEELAHGWIA
jgi:hypothetical protein